MRRAFERERVVNCREEDGAVGYVQFLMKSRRVATYEQGHSSTLGVADLPVRDGMNGDVHWPRYSLHAQANVGEQGAELLWQ